MAEQMKTERRMMTMELRASNDDGAMKVSGYAAKYNQWSDIGWFREIIAPGAFADTLNADVRALFNHDPNIVLGRTTNGTLTLREDETGLWMECTFPDTGAARDIYTLIQRGDITQQSFAFEVPSRGDIWSFPDKGDPERTLLKVKLWDVSPVTYPAYEDTTVAARSMEAVRGKTEEQKHIQRMAQYLKLREREVSII